MRLPAVEEAVWANSTSLINILVFVILFPKEPARLTSETHAQPGASRDEVVATGGIFPVSDHAGLNDDIGRHGDVGPADFKPAGRATVSLKVRDRGTIIIEPWGKDREGLAALDAKILMQTVSVDVADVITGFCQPKLQSGSCRIGKTSLRWHVATVRLRAASNRKPTMTWRRGAVVPGDGP